VRLTLHTDYALRVLLYAALKPGQLCTIPELVRHFDISRGHLMKVVHGLARAGYLQTIRGKNGGLRLACPPAAIRVAAVVRHVHADAIAQLGEAEAEDLVGNTLRYIRDRLTTLFGEAAWEESGSRDDSPRF